MHYHRLAVDYHKDPKVCLCNMVEEVAFLYRLTAGASPKKVKTTQEVFLLNRQIKENTTQVYRIPCFFNEKMCTSTVLRTLALHPMEHNWLIFFEPLYLIHHSLLPNIVERI